MSKFRSYLSKPLRLLGNLMLMQEIKVTCPCFMCVCVFCDSFLCFISLLLLSDFLYLE